MSLALVDIQPTDDPRITEITVLKDLKDATVGETIRAMFPDAAVHVLTEDDETVYEVEIDFDNFMTFSKKIWNSPYQKGESHT